MSEIPDDIREAARLACDELFSKNFIYSTAIQPWLEAALLAERLSATEAERERIIEYFRINSPAWGVAIETNIRDVERS